MNSLVLSDDREFALDSILIHLQSLQRTISIDQFLPRCYFKLSLNVDRSFDPGNVTTYTALREFIDKYTITEKGDPSDADEEAREKGSWGEEALLQVKRFQSYDALDIDKYIETKKKELAAETPNGAETDENSTASTETIPANSLNSKQTLSHIPPVTTTDHTHGTSCKKATEKTGSCNTSTDDLSGIAQDRTSETSTKSRPSF